MMSVTTMAGGQPPKPDPNKPPPGAAPTVGKCKFPFQYHVRSTTKPFDITHTVTYSTCAKATFSGAGSNYYWCSQEDIYDDKQNTKWGICADALKNGCKYVYIPILLFLI